MKHLHKFLEAKSDLSLTREDSIKINKIIDSLKYILEDEGYVVVKYPHSIQMPVRLFDKPRVEYKRIDMVISKDCKENEFISSEFEEFLDRLKEELNQFDVKYAGGSLPMVWKSASHSNLRGNNYVNIYIRKKQLNESRVFESLKKSDVLDIIQELKDNGFNAKIDNCWATEDYSPFKTLSGDMRSGYDNKSPGKFEYYEFKGGLKSYKIKLTYKNGVEFNEFENCHSMFIEALNRLEELAKVFKKVFVSTNVENGLIKPTFEILVITNQKSEVSIKDQFIKLLNDNDIKVEGTYEDVCRVAVLINSKPKTYIGDLDRMENKKKYGILVRKIKSICKNKFKTGMRSESNAFMYCIINFNIWDK